MIKVMIKENYVVAQMSYKFFLKTLDKQINQSHFGALCSLN